MGAAPRGRGRTVSFRPDADPGAAGAVGKGAFFLGALAAVIVPDLATKLLVQRTMSLYQQIDLVGDYLRLTFIYNPGAAFGVHLGPHTRGIFLVLSVLALVVLGALYRATPATDRVRLVAIALICGGAIGNLVDRLRSPRGVVDFIDIGLGDLRWPVFNLADVGVTVGAILLALSLFRDDRRPRRGGRRRAAP